MQVNKYKPSVPQQTGNISQMICSYSEVFSAAGRRYASRLFWLLFYLHIWSSSCLKKRQYIKSGLFMMAVIPLTAALIACRKWVGVCIFLFMVSRGTPWRRPWQLQWFLWFMVSRVCLSDLKVHFGWGKRWRKCVTFSKRGFGGAAGQGAGPEGAGFHTQLCYPSPGWVWPSNFIHLQVSVFSLANGIKTLTLSALRPTQMR